MLDLQKTVTLIKGGLLEPRATWEAYLAEGHPWKETVLLLTGPLIVGSAVLAALVRWLFGGYYVFSPRYGGAAELLLALALGALGVTLASFVLSFLAGVFKGRTDFSRALAAVSLAAIPSYIGNVIGALPWIGWLVSIVLAILSLVFLYQIIPLYLEVPQDRRVPHYAASLVVMFLASLVLSALVGVGALSSRHPELSRHDEQAAASRPSGMFGSFGRRAELMDAAANDQYDPPSDGYVSEAQMEQYLVTMRKTAELRGEQDAHMRELSEKGKKEESVSLSDIGKLTGTLMGAATAEMEVVKTAGGNWAEHQWVKEQLRVARIQKDIDDAVRHNYALYQKHADELKAYDAEP